ncbi:hypothetical protein [Paraglaciecola sp. L3A3]|uniref:hypothetical protein n=1 Tax=Paraglaciecola sp. L3A3 TaxID=2686358 RepID=UPI00131CE081|nr:hypothetical protein [Paraglaciecola sp. L3A3]
MTISSKVIFITIISSIVLLGCTSQNTPALRKVTYPANFKYTERKDLRSDMHELAIQMGGLDKALLKPLQQSPIEVEQQRTQVLSALKNMERIATNLKSGNSGANHPFMEDYMQVFVAQIDEARVAASFEQPRYYFAGKVAGACANCHKINR